MTFVEKTVDNLVRDMKQLREEDQHLRQQIMELKQSNHLYEEQISTTKGKYQKEKQ